MNKNKSEKFVFLAYLSVCIIWGSTYFAMRIAVTNFPPELFAGIRFFLAGSIVLIYSLIRKRVFPSNIKDFVKAVLPGVFMLAGSNGLVMYAEQWVHSGITSVILSGTPLFIAVMEFILFKDKRIGIVGVILLSIGFFGTSMVIASGKDIGSIDIKGGLLILTASLLWASGSIYSNRIKSSGDLTTHIGLQMFSAGVVLSTIGIVGGDLYKMQFNSNVIFSMFYLVVFGSIIGYSANMFVLSKWPASIAITSTYINPIVAVFLGFIFLNEGITANSLLFMGLTLTAVIGLHFRKHNISLKKLVFNKLFIK